MNIKRIEEFVEAWRYEKGIENLERLPGIEMVISQLEKLIALERLSADINGNTDDLNWEKYEKLMQAMGETRRQNIIGTIRNENNNS